MSIVDIKAEIDKSWTLFLDRDGVINIESVGSYITSWDEFRFIGGAVDAITTLSHIFGNVIVVTNQRGVGRGIMTMDALKEINGNMCAEIAENGGRIDRAYSCIASKDEDHNRKPNTGMALQAQEDFPGIDFKRSVMVGNSMSDMEFGKRLSMYTVFLTTKHEPFTLPNDLIDAQYTSLEELAKSFAAAEMVG